MNTKNRKIEGKTTKQVAFDIGLHKLVKTQAARGGETIRDVVERALTELMDLEKWELT